MGTTYGTRGCRTHNEGDNRHRRRAHEGNLRALGMVRDVAFDRGARGVYPNQNAHLQSHARSAGSHLEKYADRLYLPRDPDGKGPIADSYSHLDPQVGQLTRVYPAFSSP